MIVLRQIEKDDYSNAKSILKVNGIEDDLSQGIIYIINNGDCIMGVSKIIIKDNYGILKYVVVKEKFRGLNYGDSLLRGILFKCKSMGINKVYYHGYDSYLLKKGFTNNKTSILVDHKLYTEVDNILNNTCCGGTNGV